MHKALFWVAVAVLQLDEVNLYSAGTALLEQNLHTLDTMRIFNDKVRLGLLNQKYKINYSKDTNTMVQYIQDFISVSQSPEEVFMEIRRPLEWHCKQMDHFVGLNFIANFNFALVGHLLKGEARSVYCVCSNANLHMNTIKTSRSNTSFQVFILCRRKSSFI